MVLGKDGYEPERKYKALEKEVDKQKIIDRIIQVIDKQQDTRVLEDLFCGCTIYKITQGCATAVRFCSRSDIVDSSKRSALQYLATVFGSSVIMKEIVPIADDELFKITLYFIKDIESEELKKILLDRFRKTKDNELLREMLLRNMPEGLKFYIEESKKENRPLDDSETGYPELTDVIGQLRDPSLLPLLCEAAEMLCTPGFHDFGFSSLYRSLLKAFCNCAEGRADEVLEMLCKMREDNEDNLELVNFVSTTADQIISQNTEKVKKIWTITEIKDVLSRI